MEEKKQKEQKIILDEEAINEPQQKIILNKEAMREEMPNTIVNRMSDEDNLVNCLSNETVIVRFIAKARGNITDPKHVLYGNMAPKSKIKFPVPMLRSGHYSNVLTDEEKKFFEYKLGLEPGALGIYRKVDNFWDDSNPQGIGRVELIKGDNYFDKSKPLDYIKLAVLRKYDDIIAPSIQVLQDKPKATYKFVIINENDSTKDANVRITRKAEAYKAFGRIEDDREKLRVIIEIIDGRPTASNTKLEYLQGKIGEIIEANTKLFLSVAKDPLLDNKVLIKRAIEDGIIANRGNYLYYKKDNTPLCNNGEEPTLNIAAKFLSLPKNQELKFAIEAKLKEE
jgi:hypothetical protein